MIIKKIEINKKRLDNNMGRYIYIYIYKSKLRQKII